MQLKKFRIEGLFGTFTHTIRFPVPADQAAKPAVVILHGRNGIGKTTILRMLDGMMRLDFNTFRQVPFESCALEFTSGAISVQAEKKKSGLKSLFVTYGNVSARLHPKESGPLIPSELPRVEAFRNKFLKASQELAFEFIDTERLYRQRVDPGEEAALRGLSDHERAYLLASSPPNPKARPTRARGTLSSRVEQFVREAQVNYRTFFATSEPDLFPKIIERLTTAEAAKYDIADLKRRLEHIHTADARTGSLGLESDPWDYRKLLLTLRSVGKRSGTAKAQALAVLTTYIEQLESRAAERGLLADRLLTFQGLMSDFLADKKVTVGPKAGLVITGTSGSRLQETQLSSGEYHLLFLMVAALVTKRLGTVIAIDEPEMSMHIAWQGKLIGALVECASRAGPLFIFATHSPELAASYPDGLVELK